MSTPITFRSITDYNELYHLADLQRTAWSADLRTSAAQMKAAVMHGGCVIAAFDEQQAVGLVYGFPAFANGHPYLHSHFMIVHPEYRNQGIGVKLKLEQRQWAIKYGYSNITWTFDPLQTRNAYLNLCKLGGTVSQYLPAVYGVDEQGIPSDRFLIRWDLLSPKIAAITAGSPPSQAHWGHYTTISSEAEISVVKEVEESKEVTGAEGVKDVVKSPARNSNANWNETGYLIPILHDQRSSSIIRWKQALHALCEAAFAHGYQIVGIYSPQPSTNYYVLERHVST